MVGRLLFTALFLLAGVALGMGTGSPLPVDRPDGPGLAARHAIRVFDERDGVGTLPFECIAEDASGYLWCGTQDGILRYNGHGWSRLPLPEADRSNWVCSVLPCQDGGIWFGTNGNGLHHWKAGVWTSYTVRTGFPGLWIPSLAQTLDAQGRSVVWVGTGKEGLWKIDETGHPEPVPGPPGRPLEAVNALLAAGDGSLWAGTPGGLAHLDQGSWSKIPAGPQGGINCLAETRGPAGADLWAGTNQGLCHLHQGRWQTYGRQQGLPSSYVAALGVQHDPDGSAVLWAATDRGLGTFRGGHWSFLDHGDGLPSSIIRSLLIAEKPGSPTLIWIGTFAGLARMVPGPWLSFTSIARLQGALVFAIHQDTDDSFWFGTAGSGLVHLAKGVWSATENVEGHAIATLFALAPGHGADGHKVLYAGTRDAGVVVGQEGKWHMWEHNAELPQSSVFALLETRDPAGAPVLWVGTRDGLVRSDRNGLKTFDKGTGLAHGHVTALAETFDERGQSVLWVGTRGGGVSRFRQGRWDTFGEAQGLKEGRIASLAVIKDRGGKSTLWVGTLSNGVARIDPEHPERPWTFFTDAERAQVPSRNVESIKADALGRIYLFTFGGVTRLTPLANGQFAFYTYSMGDGLPAVACTMGSSLVDHAGRLWTGTVAGVALLDPSREPQDLLPKPLKFEKCLEVGGGQTVTEGAILTHNQNHLRFEFSLLSFYREADTRYRVQLVGLDPVPGPWRADSRQDYVALPDGAYVLKVWARDHAGNLSGPLQLAFRIRPAPWRHPAAYVVYAALFLAAGWGFSRLRIRLLRSRNRELQGRIEQATAALREREKQLETQAAHLSRTNAELRVIDKAKNRFLGIAAHDLRNPLSGIVLTAQLILENQDPENVAQDLEKIIDQARGMADLIGRFLDVTAIEAGKVEVQLETVNLSEPIQLRASGFMQQAAAKGLELRVACPAQGPMVRCDPKFMDQILDNLLSNAIKFSPSQTVIQVRVEDAGTTGRLTVQDQGPGLTPEDQRNLFERFTKLSAKPTGGEPSLGLGLSIVKGMVDAMNGTIRVESEPGNGAKFILDLPKASYAEMI